MTWVSKFACTVSIPMRKCCMIVVVTRMKLCVLSACRYCTKLCLLQKEVLIKNRLLHCVEL